MFMCTAIRASFFVTEGVGAGRSEKTRRKEHSGGGERVGHVTSEQTYMVTALRVPPAMGSANKVRGTSYISVQTLDVPHFLAKNPVSK